MSPTVVKLAQLVTFHRISVFQLVESWSYSLNSSYFRVGSCIQKHLVMSEKQPTNVPAVASERLGKNAQLADTLIANICQKVVEIETMRSNQLPENKEIAQIREESELLHREIEKWRELLIIRQIRNGRKYVRNPAFCPKVCLSEVNGQSSGEIVTEVVKCNKIPIPVSADSTVGAGIPKSEKQGCETPETQATKNGKGANKSEALKAVKQDKGKGKQEGSNPPPKKEGQAQVAEVVDVSRLDFRVGRIVQCERHPDAESLYLEKVDVGEENPRTVVSGLVNHIPLEQMQNRMVILLCNLKPAKMRGITSEAMVMCASTPAKVEILSPPEGAAPGDLVDFEGFTRNPDPIMNPKKKIFESVAPDLKTDGACVATYKGIPFTIKGKGVVTTQTLPNVNIK